LLSPAHGDAANMKFVRPPLKLPVGFLHEIKPTGEKKEAGRLLKGRGKDG